MGGIGDKSEIQIRICPAVSSRSEHTRERRYINNVEQQNAAPT